MCWWDFQQWMQGNKVHDSLVNCSLPLIIFLQRIEKFEEMIHSLFNYSKDVQICFSFLQTFTGCLPSLQQSFALSDMQMNTTPKRTKWINFSSSFHLSLFGKKGKGKKYKSCYLQEFKPSALEYIKFRKHINVPQNPQDRFQLAPPRCWWQNILAT